MNSHTCIATGSSTGDRLVVVLDGVIGYSSSFLEEAFGGLVWATDVSPETIKATLEIRADDIAYRPAKLTPRDI